MNVSKKQFVIYLIVVFGLAWVLQGIGSVCANNGNKMLFQIVTMAVMYMPFLGVLFAKIPLKGMGWVPHLKGKLRYIFFALWMPALLSVIGGVLFFTVFPHTFDGEFLTLTDLLEEAGALQKMQEQGITIPMYIGISTIQAMTIAPFINMLVALGEEVGWRGAMYPYLKEKFGIIKGRIVGGVIWGVWHWPLMILAGYEYGMDYIGAPFLGLIVFAVSTVCMGILLDYTYEKTECIWMPALMHGAINAFTIGAYLLKPEYSRMSILGPMHIGVIGMIPMTVLAVIICVANAKKAQ